MENIVLKACGLDVHQASVTGCILRQGTERQIKTFGTNTSDLMNLKSWLHAHEITHVAMESTGVFWKPVIYMHTYKLSPKIRRVLLNFNNKWGK